VHYIKESNRKELAFFCSLLLIDMRWFDAKPASHEFIRKYGELPEVGYCDVGVSSFSHFLLRDVFELSLRLET